MEHTMPNEPEEPKPSKANTHWPAHSGLGTSGEVGNVLRNRIADRLGVLSETTRLMWQRDPALLDDACVELSVGMELFGADLWKLPDMQGVFLSPYDLFLAFLDDCRFPNWEPVPESVLDDLTLKELLTVFASEQLVCARWFLKAASEVEGEKAVDAASSASWALNAAELAILRAGGPIVARTDFSALRRGDATA